MPIALVTGASRGIGQAAAVVLARAGFDVAMAARTIHEGDGVDDGDFFDAARPIAGSLDATAVSVIDSGARALPLVVDLLDRSSLERGVARVLDTWGRIDVLVNNAVYHRGNNTPVSELTPPLIDSNLQANVISPLVLIGLVLPGMLAQGGGRVINLTSRAGRMDPPARAGEGGWGVLYGMSKAALDRIPGVLALEAGERGILCFNLNPGFVRTAVVGSIPGQDIRDDDIPVAVPARAIGWLAQAPEAAALNGQTLSAVRLTQEHGLGG